MRGEKPVSLLVRNLRYTTSPDRVRKFFEQFGDVRDVYLPLDYYSKLPRGFGFVEFTREEDAEAALDSLNRHAILDGNEVSVTIAQQGRKSPETMRHREKVVRPSFRNEYRSPDRRGRRRNRSYSYTDNGNSRYRAKRGRRTAAYGSRSTSSHRQWYYSRHDKRYTTRGLSSYDRFYSRHPNYKSRRFYSRQPGSRYSQEISPHNRLTERYNVSRSSLRASEKTKFKEKPARQPSRSYERSKLSDSPTNKGIPEAKKKSTSATNKEEYPQRDDPADDLGSAEPASDDNMSSHIATSTDQLSPTEDNREQSEVVVKDQSQSPG